MRGRLAGKRNVIWDEVTYISWTFSTVRTLAFMDTAHVEEYIGTSDRQRQSV